MVPCLCTQGGPSFIILQSWHMKQNFPHFLFWRVRAFQISISISALEIALGLRPRAIPRAIPRASGCKINASANLSVLGGRNFQYIPPLVSVILHYYLLKSRCSFSSSSCSSSGIGQGMLAEASVCSSCEKRKLKQC